MRLVGSYCRSWAMMSSHQIDSQLCADASHVCECLLPRNHVTVIGSLPLSANHCAVPVALPQYGCKQRCTYAKVGIFV